MSVEILDLAALALTAVFFALLYYLHKKKHIDFGVRTILAVGLGLIVGLVFKGHHTYVAAVGTIYAHVVSAVVIPLLIFSIISSITNLGNSVRLKNIGLKTVFFLVLNTFFASLITLIAGVVADVRHGVKYESGHLTDTAKEVPTFVDTVISLFPQNLASHWGKWRGGAPSWSSARWSLSATTRLYRQEARGGRPLQEVYRRRRRCDGPRGQLCHLLHSVCRPVPHRPCRQPLFSGRPRPPAERSGALADVLCAIQAFVVEGALIKIVGKLDPVQFFKGVWPAGTVAFTSQSSVGAHPCHGQPADQEAGRQRGHRRLWCKSGCKPRYAGLRRCLAHPAGCLYHPPAGH